MRAQFRESGYLLRRLDMLRPATANKDADARYGLPRVEFGSGDRRSEPQGISSPGRGQRLYVALTRDDSGDRGIPSCAHLIPTEKRRTDSSVAFCAGPLKAVVVGPTLILWPQM